MAGATAPVRQKRSSNAAGLDYFCPCLTADQVALQAEDISGYRDQLLTSLGNAKSEKKDMLRKAINGICDAYLNLSNAYMYKLGQEMSVEANSKLSTPSYANAVKHKAPITANKIALDRGKPIPISTGTRVVIGPSDNAKAEFTSARDTKEKFLKSVNPVKLRLHTKRINFTGNNSIVLETDKIDVDKLRNCPELKDAGLEIKPETKLNPRIIVHGIPVEYTKEDIAESILELNLPDFTQDDVKIVSLYPPKQKTHRSCIVEVTSECRKALERLPSIYIKWQSCKFADHISVLQCFKCLKFGHKAATCTNKANCSSCAGSHASENCTSEDTICCYNCLNAKMSVMNHSAYDKSKCPLLRKRIERKAGSINYG